MTTYSGLSSYLRVHRKTAAILVVVLIAGVVTGTVAVISNTLQYPGATQVLGQPISLAALALGANGTSLAWYVGIAKNVSVAAQPNGYVGNAHIVYEVDATGVDCLNVTLRQMSTDAVHGCSAGANVVYWSTASKYVNGATVPFYFTLTIYQDYGSVTLRIYAVAN